MLLSNGNFIPQKQMKSPINIANLAVAPAQAQVNSALNNSMIARIHNVLPGCGSCGRKG